MWTESLVPERHQQSSPVPGGSSAVREGTEPHVDASIHGHAKAGMGHGEGFHTEHDLLGDKEVPSSAYYGVRTARELENFHITGASISHCPDLIRALAMVKLAAARARAVVTGQTRVE
jgi:hypothetical protein